MVLSDYKLNFYSHDLFCSANRHFFYIVLVKDGKLNDSEEDGTRHFMVNVIEPQFNLHSEEANVSFYFRYRESKPHLSW